MKEVNDEKAILCCVLESPEFFEELLPALEPEEFSDKRHRGLWQALKAMRERGASGVRATELEYLLENGQLDVDKDYIWELRQYVPELPVEYRGAHAHDEWIRSVKDAAKSRSLREKVERALKMEGFQDLASSLMSVVIESTQQEGQDGFAPLSESLPEFDRRLARWSQGLPDEDVEPTGFPDLDAHLGGGLPKGNLAIIGARTASFKTTLAWQIAMNVAERIRQRGTGGCVAFASLEMDRQRMLDRALCSLAKVELSRVKQGRLTSAQQERVAEARDYLGQLVPHIRIYDGLATSDLLRYETLKVMAREDVRMLFVDFAELVSDEGDSEHRRVVGIYRAAREFAQLRNIPVVYMSQMNRAVEHDLSGSRLPGIHNVMQGGEDVAATILLLYYPYGYERLGQRVQVASVFDYQNVEESDSTMVREMKQRANKGRVYLLIAKARYSGVAPIKLNVVPEWTFITSYDPESEREGVVKLVARKYERTELSGKDLAAGERDF